MPKFLLGRKYQRIIQVSTCRSVGESRFKVQNFRWKSSTIIAREHCTLNWKKPVAVFLNWMRRFNKEAASMPVGISYWMLTLCFWREGYFLENLLCVVHERVNNSYWKIERWLTDVWVDSKYIFRQNFD